MDTQCPVCGAKYWQAAFAVKDMYTGMPYELERCKICALGHTKISAEELAQQEKVHKLYEYGESSDAGKRFGELTELVMRALRRLRILPVYGDLPSKGAILDVGCGRGTMLNSFKQLGWETWGTELNEQIAHTARAQHGDKILIGDLGELDFNGKQFDLITFWHVLEHVQDPKRTLIKAMELLKPNGRLLIAVPNFASMQAQLSREHWLHLDVPRHLWHFSDQHLITLCRSLGLKLRTMSHFSFEYGPYGLFQSLIARSGLGHFLFTKLLRGVSKQDALSLETAKHIFSAPALLWFGFASFPLEAIFARMQKGGAITLVFEHARGDNHG